MNSSGLRTKLFLLICNSLFTVIHATLLKSFSLSEKSSLTAPIVGAALLDIKADCEYPL
jgi:hypothetical protein